MKTNRRSVLKAGLAVGSLAALGLNPARAAELRRLKVAFGTKALNGQSINNLLCEPLGYDKAAGFTLEFGHLGSTSLVQVALDKGTYDVGALNPSFDLPLFAKHELPPLVAFFEYTYPYKWDIVVKPESPIKSYDDLAGKKVGVANLGTTDYPVTRSVLKANGVDPDGITWQAVGEGVTAGVALQRGVIDALAYYDVGFGIIENAGIALRYLPRPPKVPKIGGLYMTTKRDFLEKNRDLCVAYGRCMAMASLFIKTNPLAAAHIFIKTWPEAAPRGVATAQADEAFLRTIRRRITLFTPPYPGAKIGQIHESEWREEAELMGLNIPDLKPLFTNDLIDEINQFDHDAVIAQAKAYKI